MLKVFRNVRNNVKKMKIVHFGHTLEVKTQVMKAQICVTLRKEMDFGCIKARLFLDLENVEV